VTVEPSDCLGCGFGVDSVTGLPSFLPDPDGNLECGPNGPREICSQNYLGTVDAAGYTAPLPAVVPANTDYLVVAGVFPFAAELSWTNPYDCSVRVEPQIDFGVQGTGMPLNSQTSPSRIEYQEQTNGGPWQPWAAIPWIPIGTAGNGWVGETKTGFLFDQVLAPGATLTVSLRALLRSSLALNLGATTASVRFRAWIIS
jgi:hypothetical protein